MADVNANIDINIDSSGAIANLRRLEVAINDYQRNIASANTAAANSHAALNRALVDGINNTGMFSAKIAPAVDSVGRFTTALEKNKLSLGEYTRYAASQLPGLSRVFRREFDTMQQVAESRVKKMQTQYLALGQTVDGTARSISMMPRGLAPGYATDVALATQRHQMFNKMIDDGSTKLLNWGKNTQWAGRQLMVGFSVPMAALGITASKTFMEIDKATTSLRRVYGDLGTSTQEVNKNIDAVKTLGKEYTKYGIALSDTVNVAATAAAAGMKNEQLTANTKESLRLATLGQIDYQQALTTTITLQNAFGTSNEELAPTVDFIGAVANQTVLSVDDLTAAIPRVAPVIKGLGGDVKDLAVLLVAMREGGVSAEQGANALKSGLANLINPTKAASKAAAQYKIDLQGIVNANRGDIMGTIKSLATALSSLDSFSRQQVLEKIFGKYQFARIGALFDHINEKTGQVKQAMDLLGMSIEDLAKVSDKSLSAISESTTVKFQAALEQLKISIAPLGQAFLKGITPIVNMISKVADAFNNLPDGVKNAAAVIIAAVAGIGPVLLMTVGLLANGFANIIKVIQVFRKGLAGIRGDGESFKYLSTAELEAAAATDALEGSVQSLTGKLLLQKGAVSSLTQEYLRFIDVAGVASAVDGLGGFGGVTGGAPTRGAAATRGASKAAMRMATGGIVPGTGNKDTIPALLTPGESVITKEATAKYAPILHEMNKGTLPGFRMGGTSIGKTLASLMTTRSGIPGVTRGRIPILQSMTDISRSRGIRPMGGRTLDPSKPPTLGGEDRTYAAIPITRGHVAPGVHATNGDTYHPGLMFWQGKDTNHQLNAGGVTGQKILSDFRMLERSGVYPPSLMIASARELGLKEESIDAAYAELKKQLRRKRDHIFENDDFLDFAGRILYGKMDKDLFSQLFNIGTLRSGGKSVAAITFEEFKKKSFALGGISIGQALRSWQTNASAVREDPKALSAILGGMQKSSTSQTLHRSTTLGLGRGSEFNPEESAILFEALRSGNAGSLVGREFSINSPVSYTAGGVEATLGALAQNTDVNRVNSLINQMYQRKNRRIDDLKLLARARRNLDAGIMPEINAKRIKELEQKTEKTAYLAEQKRLQQQIKELAPRGHQNVIFEQRFPKGSPLLDVNAQTGGAGTYMGKNVAHEQEFISPGSKIRIVDIQVDPKTGLTKIITEALPMRFASGGIVPGTGNGDTVPALLTPGESVVNKKATEKYGPILHQMNQGTLRGFAVGDENIQTSRSRAPGNIQRQTKAMTWDTREAELEILKAAGLAITNASSHIVPSEAGQPKIWKAGFLQADLQELNHYIDKTKNFAKKAMEEQETVAKIVRETGLSEKEVIRNLDYFSKGVHATTRESAMVLKELASIKGGAVDSAIASVLSTRLAGNYYETMDQRQYKSFGNPVSAYTPEQLLGLSSMQTQSSQSKFSGKNIGLPNSVHKELKKQAREELIQSGKFGGTIDDQERAVQQRYIKLVQQKEGKLRARLIAEERDFLMTRGVERNLATQLARRADLEGKLGMAAAKAEARARKNTSGNMPSPSESSPIFLGMPTMPTGKGEGDEPISPKSFSKVGAGIGMAAGLAASVLPMMMQDQNGKFLGMDANMLSMGSMFAQPAFAKIGSSIGKIAAPLAAEGGILAEGGSLAGLSGVGGPVTIAIAAAAAVTAGSLYLWRKNIDDSAKETANLTANLGVTANSVQTMGKVLGKSTPQERMKFISAGFTGAEQQKLQENVIPVLQSQEGQNLIAQLKSSSPMDRSKKIEDYLNSAIATRMMNKEDAQVFARAVGAELKDGLTGMRIAKNILGQKEGSQGMLDLSEQRLKSLKSDLRIQQVMAASGQSKTVTADAAAAAIGGAVQGFQDLGNVIALTQEDYQNGKISLEQYNKTMDEVSQAQKQYSSWLNKSIGGSMEFGGSMQALTDQMVATGRFNKDQIDSFHHSFDIGVGGIGTTAYEQQALENAKNTDPRYAAALKGTGSVIASGGVVNAGRGGGGTYIVDAHNKQTQEDLDYIKSVKDRVAETQNYLQNNQNKIEADLMGKALEGKISLEEAQAFVLSLKDGSENAAKSLKELASGADVMTVIFSQQARLAGKTDLYINTGKKFMNQGGDISAYQSFFENKSVDGRREAALQTFNRLDFGKQMSQLKDYTTMSPQLGSEGSAGLINTFLYRKAQDEGNTSAITKQASKAEKAGVGTAFGNIAADLSVKDNGKQVPINEWIQSTDIVIKQLENWNKGNKEQKKKAFLTILSQTTMNGKNLTSAQAQDAYKQLINQFGEAQIINLSSDQITKVIDIQFLLNKNSMLQIEAEAELRNAMASGDQKAIEAAGRKLYALSQQAQSYRGSIATTTTNAPTPEGRTETTGTGGAKQLNFFQQLEKDTNAQAQMFPGLMNKLKSKFPNIPKAILDMIGSGAQGKENLQSLLSANGKRVSAVIAKYTKNIINESARAIQDEITANNKRVQAIASMKAAGFDDTQVQTALASDSFMQELDAMGNTKDAAKQLKPSLDALAASQKALADISITAEQALQNQRDAMQKDADVINNALAKQEDQIKIDNAAKFLATNGMTTDEMHHQIDANNRIIQQEQDKIDAKQKQIDDLSRQQEINNRVSDALSHDLEIMDQQEQKIRETYQERIDALNKVAAINEHIAQQQQNQIGLAKALSEGDVYAAAQAAQQMQQDQVQYAKQQQQDALQTGMQNAIDNLRTPSGLTKKQAEQQINAIKEQSYQTSLRIRDIQDEIYNIQNGQMKTLQNQNEQYSRKLQYNEEDLNWQLETTDFQGHSRKWWTEHLGYLANAMTNTNGLADATQRLVNLMNQYNAGRPSGSTSTASSAGGSLPQESSTGQSFSGMTGTEINNLTGSDIGDYLRWKYGVGTSSFTMATGGLVPRKYASGGHVNMDSVPAMLTPGEFVMRKAAVHKYGIGALSDMNTGRWDVPKYNTGKLYAPTPNVGTPSPKNMQNNISAPVYNTYSINVPVNQPGASADEIASKVMMKIKNIENSSIRRIGGY